MTLSKNAIGNLLNRYKAVLKKCHMMNTFGSLAIAGMLIMGGAGLAGATAPTNMSEIGTAGFTDAPALDAVLGAGTMTAPSGGVTIEFGGISGATDTVINVDGLNNINPTNVTLNGTNSGNVLSEGNIIVTMTENPNSEGGTGFNLFLGGDGVASASLNGDLVLNGSTRSTAASNIQLYTQGATEVSINNLTLTNNATANIQGENGKLITGTLKIGEAGVSKGIVEVGIWLSPYSVSILYLC